MPGQRIEQRELLRADQLLPGTAMVVRGGRDTAGKLRRYALRTARGLVAGRAAAARHLGVRGCRDCAGRTAGKPVRGLPHGLPAYGRLAGRTPSRSRARARARRLAIAGSCTPRACGLQSAVVGVAAWSMVAAQLARTFSASADGVPGSAV